MPALVTRRPLLPASDDRSETHVVITDPADGAQRAIHFQEWWVRYRAQVPTHSFAFVGAEKATAGPGVAEAIEAADVVFLAPSNPVVSDRRDPGDSGYPRRSCARPSAPVVGYSPIIAGKPLRGMADECLPVIGVASTSEAVGRLLRGSRGHRHTRRLARSTRATSPKSTASRSGRFHC